MRQVFGYATHGLLDACTSYGTVLFWPFSNERLTWNNISIVDPLLTIPALILLLWLQKQIGGDLVFLQLGGLSLIWL